MNRLLTISAIALAAANLHAADGVQVGEEILLLTNGPGKGLQAEPAVAHGGGVYLVVWREGWHGEGGRARILAARVDQSGKRLDPQGIPIAPADRGVQERPRVAFGGGVFLIVWQDLRNGVDYDVLAARLSPAGKLLDEKPIAIAAGRDNQAIPDVASDGEGFVAVWQGVVREQNLPVYYSFARPVTADGKTGKPVRLMKQHRPQIAWNGQAYLLVVAQILQGQRLKRNAEPIDAKRRYIIKAPAGRHWTRAIAGGKGNWLVIADRSQPDYWGWGGPGAIQCQLVNGEGDLDTDLAEYIRNLPGNERNTRKYKLYDDWLDFGGRARKSWPHGPAAVAWDGRDFVAVWQRHHLEQKVMFANCDLLASRVKGWKGLDRDAVPVAAGPTDEKSPALASDGAGGLLCAYEKHAADGTVQIAARLLRAQSDL